MLTELRNEESIRRGIESILAPQDTYFEKLFKCDCYWIEPSEPLSFIGHGRGYGIRTLPKPPTLHVRWRFLAKFRGDPKSLFPENRVDSWQQLYRQQDYCLTEDVGKAILFKAGLIKLEKT